MSSGGGGGDSSVGTQDSTFPHPATPPGHQQQAYFCRLAIRLQCLFNRSKNSKSTFEDKKMNGLQLITQVWSRELARNLSIAISCVYDCTSYQTQLHQVLLRQRTQTRLLVCDVVYKKYRFVLIQKPLCGKRE